MHVMAPSLPSVGLGAMTAALVIVPAGPVRTQSASAHCGRFPGSETVGPREMPSGAPWMVRLSMGSTDVMLRVTSAAGKHFLGSHR